MQRKTYSYATPFLVIKLGSYIRDAFNKLLDIFVQAFKIVVDSCKFSMLLLYIF